MLHSYSTKKKSMLQRITVAKMFVNNEQKEQILIHLIDQNVNISSYCDKNTH